MDQSRDLEVLIRSKNPIIYVETHEERRVRKLVRGVSRNMKLPLFLWSATKGLQRDGVDNTIHDTANAVKVLGWMGASPVDAIYLLFDFHRWLDDARVVRKMREVAQHFEERGRSMILTAPVREIPPELEKMIVYFNLQLPSAREIKVVVHRVVKELQKSYKIKVDISQEKYDRLIDMMRGFTVIEAERAVSKAVLDDLALTERDIDRIIEIKKQVIERNGLLEYFHSDDSLGEVAGMGRLKAWLESRKAALSPKARSIGLPAPKGVLLLGVPGCGKSLIAKAVAKSWRLPLLRFDPGRIYGKWMGESEKNLRHAIELAEGMAPCVMWIDEIEKGLSNVTSSDSDAGLSKRVFGTILSWLQEKKGEVFIVATSNDISALPPELLRKGRFDEIFFVDLPSTEERQAILEVHLKKRKQKLERFDLEALTGAVDGFSGAEIEQAVVSALYSSFAADRELDTPALLQEIQNTLPLSATMMEKITALRLWAKTRTVPAT